MSFQNKKRTACIYQMVAHDLGVAILSGRHSPGHRFKGEIEHSAELEVSRTSYREATRILTGKGLLESRPKMGTRVRPRACWNVLDPQVLDWMFAQGPDVSFAEGFFELRAIIEPAAAAFAAERRTSPHLEQMEQGLDEMRRHGLADPVGQTAYRRFHQAILDAAANEALQVLANSVDTAARWTTQLAQRSGQQMRNAMPEHLAVYKAIAARESCVARSAMTELIRLALLDIQTT